MGNTPVATVVLGLLLIVAGITHFVVPDYLQQVPPPLPAALTVYASGVVEIAVGIAVLAPPSRRWGAIAAGLLFVAVLPANLYQAIAGVEAFGMDAAWKRWARLPFQLPLFWLCWHVYRGTVTDAG